MVNKNILYNELQIIMTHQSILSQKVGILFAVNTLLISAIISTTISFNNPYILLCGLTTFISLLMNLWILFPNFKEDYENKSSKYFYDYAKMNEEEIEKYIFEENNISNQIKINSKILKDKYKLYMISLSILFCFIPFTFPILKKINCILWCKIKKILNIK